MRLENYLDRCMDVSMNASMDPVAEVGTQVFLMHTYVVQ